MTKKEAQVNNGQIAGNKKAFHDYIVMDKLEAGIELCGTEVKSCRLRSVTLTDGYVKIEKGQAYLLNVYIAPYNFGNYFNHDGKRSRRLLMHKREILKLSQQIKEKGYTIVPLRFYLRNGKVKVEIAACKGKTHGDKRESMREKQADLDTRRELGARR